MKHVTQYNMMAADCGVTACACKGIRRCLQCDTLKGKGQLEANEPKVNISD